MLIFPFVSCGDRGVLFIICHCIDLAIWFFSISQFKNKKERVLTNQHYGTFRFNLTIKFNSVFLLLFHLGVLMHRRTHFDIHLNRNIHYLSIGPMFLAHTRRGDRFISDENGLKRLLIIILFYLFKYIEEHSILRWCYWQFRRVCAAHIYGQKNGKQWRLILDDHCVLISYPLGVPHET